MRGRASGPVALDRAVMGSLRSDWIGTMAMGHEHIARKEAQCGDASLGFGMDGAGLVRTPGTGLPEGRAPG